MIDFHQLIECDGVPSKNNFEIYYLSFIYLSLSLISQYPADWTSTQISEITNIRANTSVTNHARKYKLFG